MDNTTPTWLIGAAQQCTDEGCCLNSECERAGYCYVSAQALEVTEVGDAD